MTLGVDSVFNRSEYQENIVGLETAGASRNLGSSSSLSPQGLAEIVLRFTVTNQERLKICISKQTD